MSKVKETEHGPEDVHVICLCFLGDTELRAFLSLLSVVVNVFDGLIEANLYDWVLKVLHDLTVRQELVEVHGHLLLLKINNVQIELSGKSLTVSPGLKIM